MKKLIGKFALWLSGWKIKGVFPNHLTKAIIIAAPHTSNWDFFVGMTTRFTQGFHSNFLIKDSWLTIPMVGSWMRNVGAVGVDRSKEKKASITQQIIELFTHREEFILTITPEGTRSYNPNWKTGFWHIATATNTPLVLIGIDAKEKQIVIRNDFELSNDLQTDIKRLKQYFSQFEGIIPHQGVKNED